VANVIALILAVCIELPIVACEKVLFHWIHKAMGKKKNLRSLT